MGKLMKRLAKSGRTSARKTYDKVETEVMATVGRKVVRDKVQAAGQVGRKAAKAGLVAGVTAAAGVVFREIRKRRKSV